MRLAPAAVRSQLVLVLAAVALAIWGCEGSRSRTSGPTGSTVSVEGEQTEVTKGQAVTAALRDPLLFRHNARFFGGRTFRWVPPVPIFILTGDAFLDRQVDALFLGQWRSATGVPGLFSRQPIVEQPPPRGIFFSFADPPGGSVVSANPLAESARASDSPEDIARAVARRLGQSPTTRTAERRRVDLPEVLSTGEIVRCEIMLDPVVTVDGRRSAYAFFNGIGRCLGFVGPARSGVMSGTCCSVLFTSDVRRVMRMLYRLPAGTPVTP